VIPEGTAVVRAYIGLGSNLDRPAEQIERAFELLAELPDTDLVARSSLYRSAPLGEIEQPDFVNAVAKIETSLDAFTWLANLQQIEDHQGRIRGERWGPRVLDLDLLAYGDEQIRSESLIVPHPGIGQRNFVLLPLREVEPDLTIPGLAPISEIVVDETAPSISRIF
jgi:2-amino-4-hydroxy-6-hydroxymethyldihydropteridine diphosphokinase